MHMIVSGTLVLALMLSTFSSWDFIELLWKLLFSLHAAIATYIIELILLYVVQPTFNGYTQ